MQEECLRYKVRSNLLREQKYALCCYILGGGVNTRNACVQNEYLTTQ